MRTGGDPALDVDLIPHLDHVNRLVALQHLPAVRVRLGEGGLHLPHHHDRDFQGRSPCSQATAAPIRSIVGGCEPNRYVKTPGGSGSARFRSASCCWSSIIPLGSSVSCRENVSARASTARES